MRKYIIDNKKGILLVLAGFIMLDILVLCNICRSTDSMMIKTVGYETIISVVDTREERVITDEELVDDLLNQNALTIEFMSKTFQIDNNVLTEKLKNEYKELDLLNQTNFEYFLAEYLVNLESVDKSLFNKQIVPCSDSKEYMVSLIKYFTNIYPDVDFTIAAGIAQIESGYSAPFMLKRNNIFGGMSNGGLIKYKNIEYGVFKFVKLLNDGYFGKGLVTVNDIGRVYNPTFNENGVKIAKPSWVANVTKARESYVDFGLVDVNILNSLKNTSN